MAGTVERGREAFGRRAWTEAFKALSAAAGERAEPLDAEDLERLAVAAYLVGRDDRSAQAWEAAHQARLQLEEPDRAAQCAQFVEAEEIAIRCGDKDLLSLARLGQGQALIAAGDTARGVAVLDEVMVSVTTGEISPIPSGTVPSPHPPAPPSSGFRHPLNRCPFRTSRSTSCCPSWRSCSWPTAPPPFGRCEGSCRPVADIDVQVTTKTLRLPPPADFLWQYVHATPMGAVIAAGEDDRWEKIERDVVAEWQQFVEGGDLVLHQPFVVATARA